MFMTETTCTSLDPVLHLQAQHDRYMYRSICSMKNEQLSPDFSLGSTVVVGSKLNCFSENFRVFPKGRFGPSLVCGHWSTAIGSGLVAWCGHQRSRCLSHSNIFALIGRPETGTFHSVAMVNFLLL